MIGTLALVLDGSGKKEEAERAYRATLQLDPDNAIAMNNLAFLLAERGGDLDQALATGAPGRRADAGAMRT